MIYFIYKSSTVLKKHHWIYEENKMDKKLKIITLMLVFISFCAVALYNGLITRRYHIITDKFFSHQSIRIILITDLHSHIYGKDQHKIVTRMAKEKPDLILLAGDIADDQVPIEGTEIFLKEIQDMAPIYYVTGNHEIWSRQVDMIKSVFKQYGVHVLEHTYKKAVINEIPLIIGGVDDPDIVRYQDLHYNWAQEILNTFEELKEETAYQILLSHRPEFIDLYKETSFDLVVSGHSHGGQIRIPLLLNGLYAPNQGWFPKYAGGHYRHEGINHVVSRGVSFNPRLPRIFNPPEIVVIEIKGDK